MCRDDEVLLVGNMNSLLVLLATPIDINNNKYNDDVGSVLV